jgi:hypothetical protein
MNGEEGVRMHWVRLVVAIILFSVALVTPRTVMACPA